MSDKMTVPMSASTPLERPKTDIPMIFFENIFYGKPFISPYEALEVISFLSGKLKEYEKRK